MIGGSFTHLGRSMIGPQFAKVMFLHVSVCPREGHVWWGACMARGMHGRGHAWQGGMCVGRHAWWGACVVGCACMPPQQILRDTVNEWAVGILLECILVKIFYYARALQCNFGACSSAHISR